MATNKRSISSDVGYIVAAMTSVGTFHKSLMERSAVDQGLATGLTMVLAYSITAVLQDTIEAVNENTSVDQDDPMASSFTSSLLAIGAGLVAQNIFKQQKDENLMRSSARTLGYWVTATGVAGTLIQTLRTAFIDHDNEISDDQEDISKALVLPFGLILGLSLDYMRNGYIVSVKDNPILKSPLKAVAAGAGIVATLVGLQKVESVVATNTQKTVDKYIPAASKSWLPIGHVASLGLLVGVFSFGLQKLYKKLESADDKMEQEFSQAPINPYVTGSIDSTISWDSLSKQGRRHIGTRISKSAISEQLDIQNAKEPIRIYIGYDSALTPEQRVELALQEIDRTDAFSRKHLLLIAPTGTGYVNYVMSDSFEYLSKGDCAQVTIQYSKKPSPMSLDKVDDGYIQFRRLVNAISKKLKELPKDKRPKMYIFGESLGAWVSQDAFLHSGTDGLIATGVNRALWIGTPELSKWHSQVLSGKELNSDVSLVGKFNNINEYLKLPEQQRKAIHYVMCTHYNDPVSHFSTRLLVQAPDWLQIGTPKPPTVPADIRFRIPQTFVQTIIDMKNALKPKPGVFTSHGHDYRADLLSFMNEAFSYHQDKKALTTIHKNLVKNDIDRGNL